MGWFSESWTTASDALGVRKYVVLGSAAASAAVLSGIVGWALRMNPTSTSGVIFHILFFLFALMAILFVVILNAATKLRMAARPRIALSFEADGPGIAQALVRNPSKVMFAPPNTFVEGSDQRANYVRIRIDAVSEVNVPHCSAAILAFARKLPGETDFTEILLPQNIKIMPDFFEVRVKIPHRIDFLSVGEKENKLYPTAEVGWPFILEKAFNHPAVFQFDIAVNDGRNTKIIKVELDWNGKWDELKGRQISVV